MKTHEFLSDWLNAQEFLLERSTFEAYKIYFGRHLIPYFERLNIDLKDLKPRMIQDYINEKLKSGRLDGKSGGLSEVSVRKHFSVLKQALNDAVLQGEINTNPALFAKMRRRKSTLTERTVLLTADEARKVVQAFEGHPLFPAVVMTLYYGLRRSEILGLKWSAIDFDKNTFTICHTVVKNTTIVCKDSTKTQASRATYELLPEVRKMLLDLKAKAPPESEYICVWDDGRLMRPDYLTRGFQRVLKRNKLPVMRFHDLRHSTASILFERGWSLEDVKNWLRHTDIETTSNIYLHYGRCRQILISHDLAGMLVNK